MEILQASPWILSAAIFLARILYVSLGTLRTILVFRSYPVYAALLGFLEIVVWVLAAGQVLQNLDEWCLVVAYAGGFAAGNVVGIWLESKLAVGVELVRAISENRNIPLAERLRASRYCVIEFVFALQAWSKNSFRLPPARALNPNSAVRLHRVTTSCPVDGGPSGR